MANKTTVRTPKGRATVLMGAFGSLDDPRFVVARPDLHSTRQVAFARHILAEQEKAAQTASK